MREHARCLEVREPQRLALRGVGEKTELLLAEEPLDGLDVQLNPTV